MKIQWEKMIGLFFGNGFLHLRQVLTVEKGDALKSALRNGIGF
jgi:hypothetical protein